MRESLMQMRLILILLTIISVIADSMLLPFYPQFFQQEFSVRNTEVTGYFLANNCLTVMLVFPLWAKIAKRINEVHLWIYTQLLSALFGWLAYTADSLTGFWIYSQLMLVCKASYLLIYPFCMRLGEENEQLNIAGLFGLLMHFGAIGGAILGGIFLKSFAPKSIYLLMITIDLVQVVVCLYIIYRFRFSFYQENLDQEKTSQITKTLANEQDTVSSAISSSQESNAQTKIQETTPKKPILTIKASLFAIGSVFLVLYFSSFLSRPFFTRYLEEATSITNTIILGLIYAIPAFVAIIALWWNAKKHSIDNDIYQQIGLAIIVGGIGVITQSFDNLIVIIIGRCLLGWAMFQSSVLLEVLIFQLSKKDEYASDFSIVHLFQNIGVLAASFSVGWLAQQISLKSVFLISGVGFFLTFFIFKFFLMATLNKKEHVSPASPTQKKVIEPS